MRLLHTADWHLGHTIRDLSREREHKAFLDWLLDAVGENGVDALLVAGDVFHTANPTAASQAQWYGFLAAARQRYPALDIVVIGGNHDSGARLDAAVPLLDAVRIRVVGALPSLEGGGIDYDRLLVPLRRADGNISAWVVALPYLRRGDLPPLSEETPDAAAAAVKAVHADVLAAALARRAPGQALVAMGHCEVAGARFAKVSERRVVGGGIAADTFSPEFAYTALGHIHLAQEIGRPNVRYSGSPLPLSIAEADYEHQVVLVDLEGEGAARIRPLPVPRSVGMILVGPAPIEDVVEKLRALPESGKDLDPPFLQVRVQIDRPDPAIRRRVEEVLAGRHARLVRLQIDAESGGEALSDALPGAQLPELAPKEVFELRYAQEHPGTDAPPELVLAFEELLEKAYAEGGT